MRIDAFSCNPYMFALSGQDHTIAHEYQYMHKYKAQLHACICAFLYSQFFGQMSMGD